MVFTIKIANNDAVHVDVLLRRTLDVLTVPAFLHGLKVFQIRHFLAPTVENPHFCIYYAPTMNHKRIVGPVVVRRKRVRYVHRKV